MPITDSGEIRTELTLLQRLTNATSTGSDAAQQDRLTSANILIAEKILGLFINSLAANWVTIEQVQKTLLSHLPSFDTMSKDQLTDLFLAIEADTKTTLNSDDFHPHYLSALKKLLQANLQYCWLITSIHATSSPTVVEVNQMIQLIKPALTHRTLNPLQKNLQAQLDSRYPTEVAAGHITISSSPAKGSIDGLYSPASMQAMMSRLAYHSLWEAAHSDTTREELVVEGKGATCS